VTSDTVRESGKWLERPAGKRAASVSGARSRFPCGESPSARDRGVGILQRSAVEVGESLPLPTPAIIVESAASLVLAVVVAARPVDILHW